MKLIKPNRLFAVCLFALALGLPLAQPAQAALPDLLPACTATGACRLCDMVNIFVTMGRWLIAGAAGLALLVIVYAGASLTMSAGNSEKVNAAKKQIIGAVLGLGLVLVAFQLVSFIIFAVTTPAASQNYNTSQTPDTGNKTQQNLGTFLGIPWWKICNPNDLISAGSQNEKSTDYKGTAVCRYWGDGTACSKIDDKGNATKKCCMGLCTNAECLTSQIVQTVTKNQTTPAGVPGPTGAGIAGCNLGSEEGTRACLLNKGKININKGACPNILTSTDCTSVVGLSAGTVEKLILANSKCNFSCIFITGGTEQGPHVSHGGPNVVDIDNRAEARSALQEIGLTPAANFLRGQTNWFVCDEGGRASSCSLAGHLHIVF